MAIYYEDMEIGNVYLGGWVFADKDEMVEYGQRFDPWPMHADPDIGDASPLGGLVASGGYTISLWYSSGHQPGAESKEWAFLGGFDWHVQFVKPLLPDTRVRGRAEVVERRLSSKPGRGLVTLQSDLMDENDEPVLKIRVKGLVATKPEE